MPAYWLGAFFYPKGLLALVKQDCYKHHSSERSGNFEQYVFQTEITARDKDHVSNTSSMSAPANAQQRSGRCTYNSSTAINTREQLTCFRSATHRPRVCSCSASTCGAALGRKQTVSWWTSRPRARAHPCRSST